MIIYYIFDERATMSHKVNAAKLLKNRERKGYFKRVRKRVLDVKEEYVKEIVQLLWRYWAIPLKPIEDI